MERTGTICVAIHNSQATEPIFLEDLCPWLPPRKREPEMQMSMAELGDFLKAHNPHMQI